MAQDQPRRQAPQIPADIKSFNQKLISEFRANRGQLSGPMAGRPLMLLTTIGKRSGQPRTVVLGFRKDSERYVVIASANGAPEHPFWYRNLLANPMASVEVGPDKFTVNASTLPTSASAWVRWCPISRPNRRRPAARFRSSS